jgi:hypothetical protein
LALFDYQGKLRAKAACETRPIFADISLNQVWLQEKDGIVPIQLATHPQSSTASEVSIPLLSNVETEISLLKANKKFQEICPNFLENTGKVRSLCERIWQLAKEPSPDAQIFESLQKGLTSAVENLGSYVAQREDYLLAHPVLFLKVHWLRLSESAKDNHPAFSIIGEKNREIAALFVNEFIALQQYFDDFSIDQADIASANPGWTADRRVCRALDAIEKSLVASLQSLESAVRSIHHSPESSLIPNIPDRDPGMTRRPMAAANTEPASSVKPQRTYGFLREIDRVSLRAGLIKDCPAGPYGLSSTSNGHVFVALRLAHCVAELNQEYRMLRCLGQPELFSDELNPLCIAADSSDRLWITELSKNRLKICDPGSEYSQFISVNLNCPTPLHMPYGICRWRDNQVLIADTLNNRILAISDTGSVEIIADGKGSNPGQFRHPTAVVQSSSAESAGIWVVDHRNHRVQKLDASGRFLLTAGKPGLGYGSLTLPFTAAVFIDGSLLVAQHMVTRCLALFAPDGKELDRVHLDFTPAGMLIHGDNLLITDADGDCLRIFRRFWSNNPC